MKKPDSKKEIVRQILHLLFGVLGIANMYFELLQLRFVFIIFVFGLIIFININFANTHPAWIGKIIDYFERKNGLIGQGVVTLWLSYLVLHTIEFVYPNLLNISMASLAIVSYGDSAGTIFGILTNKFILPYNKKKNLIGLALGIFFAFLGSLIFVNPFAALSASILAMTFESMDLRIKSIKIDDNLLIPFIAFITLYLIT